MLDRLSTSVRRAPESVAVRSTASARGVREAVSRSATSARQALTWRRAAWAAAIALAFAVPFAAQALRGEPARAGAVAEPHARGLAPDVPDLRKVAALPQPPSVVPQPTSTVAAATPAPVPTPAAVAPAPAPAPTPAPEREVFDLEG